MGHLEIFSEEERDIGKNKRFHKQVTQLNKAHDHSCLKYFNLYFFIAHSLTLHLG